MIDKKQGLRAWTPRDSAELYQVNAWGDGYFAVGDDGNLRVQPQGEGGPSFSLLEVVDALRAKGEDLPVLLRVSGILEDRIRRLSGAFADAIREYGYGNRYRPVFPIKVNQQCHVVEEMVAFGKAHGLGLEAGSKPELLAALAQIQGDEALIVCNGYKDRRYVETALLAQQLGAYVIVVVDRMSELDTIVSVAKELGIRPHIGVRAKLATRGAGKWLESTGDRSKFGLTAAELVQAARSLKRAGMADCLEMLHFHIGSQITTIRAIKDAMRESTRIYTGLHDLGAGLKFMDVGGGLAVDYDGSRTNFHSSANYTLQEYANDVVYALKTACEEKGIPMPTILSESGRALSAHHSVLVFNVLGTSEPMRGIPPEAEERDEEVIGELVELCRAVTAKNFQEAYHDGLAQKEEAINLFNVGLLDLEGRALVEHLFWVLCGRIQTIIGDLSYVPDEMEGLEKALADTYYCNFSVFQSAPDHWAVNQLFPVMPIHRLRERPVRKGTLADLTCDSDGKIDKFIDLRDVKSTLELHPLREGESYYLGMFLVGAYQEILGDLHNLFGDTTAVHIGIDSQGRPEIGEVVAADTVDEVLGYVQYDVEELRRRVGRLASRAVEEERLTPEVAEKLVARYNATLQESTYLG